MKVIKPESGREMLFRLGPNTVSKRSGQMCEKVCKAIIYKDLEDVYGPCGCGMNLATCPYFCPEIGSSWSVLSRQNAMSFGKGDDFRRISGFTCNNVFEHEMEGAEYLANFSCCSECAEKAVEKGYRNVGQEIIPMALR